MSSPTEPRKKTILITGCSAGGMGHAMALAFHATGTFQVFATARDLSKMSALRDLPNVTLLALDVSKPEDVAKAVEAVQTYSHGTLDALINNAGVALVSPVLDQDISRARDMFESNFWGCVLMVDAFKKMLVRAGGVVVNNCSIVKWVDPVWQGFYTASKAAQTAWSETLRLEIAPLGVRVITVNTGAINTPILVKNRSTFTLPADSFYQSASAEITARATGTEKLPKSSPEKFAAALVRDVMHKSRSGRVDRGMVSSTAVWLRWLLPDFLFDFVRLAGTGLGKVRMPGIAKAKRL